MRKALTYLALMLVMMTTALAFAIDEQTINMKTTDFFIVQVQIDNVNDIDLRNCVPFFYTGEDVTRDQVAFTPEIFDLKGRGARQLVSAKIQDLPPGYYQGNINVRCERYDGFGELVDIANILAFTYIPKYEIYVTPAGEGQNYVFAPLQSYTFLARPNELKTATFHIVNTGEIDLEVDITPEAAYQEIVSVEPRTATIPPKEGIPFKISIKIPSNYTGLNTSLTVKIGDFTEQFPIKGTEQGLTLGGPAVAQNLLYGTISAGKLKIPIWIILTIIIIGSYILFKPKKKKGRGKKK